MRAAQIYLAIHFHGPAISGYPAISKTADVDHRHWNGKSYHTKSILIGQEYLWSSTDWPSVKL